MANDDNHSQSHQSDAERILIKLGIERPEELDLELIAYSLGLEVRYRPLESCEARIVGLGNRGIISVRDGAHHLRQRFSIAHEIGHWTYHRGRTLSCQSKDISELDQESKKSGEKLANEFASHLILPEYLLLPKIKQFGNLSFSKIISISEVFRVSITATARRIIKAGEFPSILISYNKMGRHWYEKSPLVGDDWIPRRDIARETMSFSALAGDRYSGVSTRRPASLFFGGYEAHKFDVREEVMRLGDGLVLTLLHVTNNAMLK